MPPSNPRDSTYRQFSRNAPVAVEATPSLWIAPDMAREILELLASTPVLAPQPTLSAKHRMLVEEVLEIVKQAGISLPALASAIEHSDNSLSVSINLYLDTVSGDTCLSILKKLNHPLMQWSISNNNGQLLLSLLLNTQPTNQEEATITERFDMIEIE